jgi:lipopolysaccharide export system protein LptA
MNQMISNKPRIRRLLVPLLLLLFSISSLSAKETFEFKSDSSKMLKPRGKKEIILTGNARISSETLVIRADKIRRFGSDLQYTQCTGNVKAHDLDRDIEISSDHLFFDTDADTMTIESWSELYDKKNEVVTRSGYLYDQRKEKITFLSINVRIFRNEVVCRSEFAKFDHNTETLELTGNPVIYKDGNEMSAFRIFYDINTEEIELVGNVSGTIETDEDEADDKSDADTDKPEPPDAVKPGTATPENKPPPAEEE